MSKTMLSFRITKSYLHTDRVIKRSNHFKSVLMRIVQLFGLYSANDLLNRVCDSHHACPFIGDRVVSLSLGSADRAKQICFIC